MTIRTLHSAGDPVTVCCTTTDRTWCRNTVTVTAYEDLPCGCRRLTCDRPGRIPQPCGMELIDRDDVCSVHTGYDEDPLRCRCLPANVATLGHCPGCPVLL